MSKQASIRLGWLKFIYAYTLVGAGTFGFGMIIFPDIIKSMFGFPDQDPITFGIIGSVYLAFGLLSIMGLWLPLQFVPVLLLQLCYKSIWFIGVVLPLLVMRQFPRYAILLVGIFATYIIGDLIVIPFSYIFSKKSESVD